jgi:PAT family beta-lactamase induction signal transducer AmpG
VVFNLPFVAYTLLAVYQPESLWLIGGGIVMEYFGYGFGFVRPHAVHDAADSSRQTSDVAHYAFASGIMNLGVMMPGMLSGSAERLGRVPHLFHRGAALHRSGFADHVVRTIHLR